MEIEPRSIWNIYCMFEWCVRVLGILSVRPSARLSVCVYLQLPACLLRYSFIFTLTCTFTSPTRINEALNPPSRHWNMKMPLKRALNMQMQRCVCVSKYVCLSVCASVCLAAMSVGACLLSFWLSWLISCRFVSLPLCVCVFCRMRPGHIWLTETPSTLPPCWIICAMANWSWTASPRRACWRRPSSTM